jgi:hypothetical protein
VVLRQKVRLQLMLHWMPKGLVRPVPGLRRRARRRQKRRTTRQHHSQLQKRQQVKHLQTLPSGQKPKLIAVLPLSVGLHW